MKVARTTLDVTAQCGGTMMPRSAFLKGGLAAVLVPIIGGCSAGAAPVSQSTTDPSNPNAPEGSGTMKAASAPPAQQPTSAPAPANHEQRPHADHGADAMARGDSGAGAGRAAIVYVCPMHPEVTSAQPGELCPKCNMKLVPKK